MEYFTVIYKKIPFTDLNFISFMLFLIIFIIGLVMIANSKKENFIRVLLTSILFSILLVNIIVYISKYTDLIIFDALNKQEILAGIFIAIPTLSTWIMDSINKNESKKIDNLNSAQQIRNNLENEKEQLVQELKNSIDNRNEKINTFDMLLILNKLESFLLKVEELSTLYNQLQSITFKMDLDLLFNETYNFFELCMDEKIITGNSDTTIRFGEIFTQIIKNKLVYGVNSKSKLDIYRDLAFILVGNRFKNLYYIDFNEIFETNKKLLEILENEDENNQVYFEEKKFIHCTFSNHSLLFVQGNNNFEECKGINLSENFSSIFNNLISNSFKERDNNDDEL